MAANNLALIESQQGRYGQALRRLGQALRKAAEIGPALVAVVATSRAWVTVQSGRFAEGLGLFEEAAQAYQAAALPLGEHYIEYADALMELRLLPEATRAARQAVQEFSAAGIPLMAAEAQLRVAQLALLAGDPGRGGRGRDAAAAGVRAADADGVAFACRPGSGGGAAGRAAPPRSADLVRARAAARRMADVGATSAAVQGFLVTGRLAASSASAARRSPR